MAVCIHCNTWAGIGRNIHDSCAALATEGKSGEEIKASVNISAPPRPLTAGGVFWAVFGALWTFSISAGIVYAIIHAVADAGR